MLLVLSVMDKDIALRNQDIIVDNQNINLPKFSLFSTSSNPVIFFVQYSFQYILTNNNDQSYISVLIGNVIFRLVLIRFES